MVSRMKIMWIKRYRREQIHMVIKAVLFLWLVIFCFFGCKQDRDADLSLSEQAIQYSYPEDNILSLRSVTTDYEGEINRLIIEFGDSSDYVKKKN